MDYITGEPPLDALPSGPSERDRGWARLVSDILSPPVVWGALALPIAFRDAPSREQGLSWAGVYILMVCIVPIVYIAWMVRRGKITDLHMRVRTQRILPFVVSLIATAIAWWTLRAMGAPPVIPLLALSSLAQIGLMALITLVWQISMHMMSIASAFVTTGLLFGTAPALIILPLVFVVAAARLKLKRHTVMQVIAGTVVGLSVPATLILNAAL
jgi:hypothetical protein